jgi:hypothetical protein
MRWKFALNCELADAALRQFEPPCGIYGNRFGVECLKKNCS